MTRDEWAARLAKRADDAERLGALAPVGTVLRNLLAELEDVDGWPATTPPPDEMLTLEDTAARLNVPKRWLTDHRHELPFLKEYVPNGTVRVSAKALDRWLATR